MSDSPLIRSAQSAQEKALKLKSMGKLEEAHRTLKEFLAKSSEPVSADERRTLAEVHLSLGELNEKLGHGDPAVSEFLIAQQVDPLNRRAGLKIVEAAVSGTGDVTPEMAPRYIEYLTYGTSSKVKREALRRLRRLLRISMDDSVNSVTWQLPLLQTLNEAWPTLNFAREYLARAHYVRGEYRQAIPYLRESLSIDTNNTTLINMLGRSYEKVGHLQEARGLYERSVLIDPSQSGIHFRLGRVILAFAVRGSAL